MDFVWIEQYELNSINWTVQIDLCHEMVVGMYTIEDYIPYAMTNTIQYMYWTNVQAIIVDYLNYELYSKIILLEDDHTPIGLWNLVT